MSPTHKFELWIAEEERMYKISDLVYKIVQNYDIRFALEILLGGYMHLENAPFITNSPPIGELFNSCNTLMELNLRKMILRNSCAYV